MKSITILGAGESGFGAAMLARQKGLKVFVSDSNKINEDRKLEMIRNSIVFEEENHSFDKIKLSDFVIKSPGISNSSEIISKIKSSGIPIVSEIEFASNYSNSFKICITGTNGKTTTTKLIYHILKRAGLDEVLRVILVIAFLKCFYLVIRIYMYLRLVVSNLMTSKNLGLIFLLLQILLKIIWIDMKMTLGSMLMQK